MLEERFGGFAHVAMNGRLSSKAAPRATIAHTVQAKPRPERTITEDYPNLVNQWDWEKNHPMRPEDFTQDPTRRRGGNATKDIRGDQQLTVARTQRTANVLAALIRCYSPITAWPTYGQTWLKSGTL